MSGRGYKAIASDLRAAIQRGDYPPGSMLPLQDDIAKRCGVNRGTVRRAINLLAAEGLVDAIRGHGTKVRDRTGVRLSVTRYAEATAIDGPWEVACFQRGLEGTTHVVGVNWQPADAIIARELEVEEGSIVCRRRNEMHAKGESGPDRVYQLQETWLPHSVAVNTPLAGADKVAGGIYRALAAVGYPPTKATEVVSARMPTQAEAAALGLRLGSPVLDVRRTTRDAAGVAVVHTHLVVAADHVSLTYPQVL